MNSTETLIMAAQEQMLNTRLIENWVRHTRREIVFKKSLEHHITPGYKLQASIVYMECHKKVAAIVYSVQEHLL